MDILNLEAFEIWTDPEEPAVDCEMSDSLMAEDAGSRGRVALGDVSTQFQDYYRKVTMGGTASFPFPSPQTCHGMNLRDMHA
jgi:hypothetical protein